MGKVGLGFFGNRRRLRVAGVVTALACAGPAGAAPIADFAGLLEVSFTPQNPVPGETVQVQVSMPPGAMDPLIRNVRVSTNSPAGAGASPVIANDLDLSLGFDLVFDTTALTEGQLAIKTTAAPAGLVPDAVREDRLYVDCTELGSCTAAEPLAVDLMEWMRGVGYSECVVERYGADLAKPAFFSVVEGDLVTRTPFSSAPVVHVWDFVDPSPTAVNLTLFEQKAELGVLFETFFGQPFTFVFDSEVVDYDAEWGPLVLGATYTYSYLARNTYWNTLPVDYGTLMNAALVEFDGVPVSFNPGSAVWANSHSDLSLVGESVVWLHEFGHTMGGAFGNGSSHSDSGGFHVGLDSVMKRSSDAVFSAMDPLMRYKNEPPGGWPDTMPADDLERALGKLSLFGCESPDLALDPAEVVDPMPVRGTQLDVTIPMHNLGTGGVAHFDAGVYARCTSGDTLLASEVVPHLAGGGVTDWQISVALPVLADDCFAIAVALDHDGELNDEVSRVNNELSFDLDCGPPGSADLSAADEVLVGAAWTVGSDCAWSPSAGAYRGSWDAASDTCTLFEDVAGEVELLDSGITLDCDGHTITGPGADVVGAQGVTLTHLSGSTVTGCTIVGFEYGVQVSFGSANTVSDNLLLENLAGIRLAATSGNVLTGNDALRNTMGIALVSADDGNIVSANGTGLGLSCNDFAGIHVIQGSDDNEITDNVAAGNGQYGISVFQSDNNLVDGNTTSYNGDAGVRLAQTLGDPAVFTTVTNNVSVGNFSGLHVHFSDYNTVGDNTASRNTGYGIRVDEGASWNSFFDNQLERNGVGYGLSGNASDNTVGTLGGAAAMAGNDVGISLDLAVNTLIDNQAITGSYGPGVEIVGSSSVGNTVSQCAISDNGPTAILRSSGAELLVEPPALTSVENGLVMGSNGAGTDCSGLCTVEVFQDDEDEAEVLLGQAVVPAGNFSVPVGPMTTCRKVRATVTDSGGNTSALSNAIEHDDDDGDGFAPHLCGGPDCDDLDPTRFPGDFGHCDNLNNTAVATGQQVELVTADGLPVSFTFDDVTDFGTTTAIPCIGGETDMLELCGAPPLCLDIDTTATYTGSVNICIDYSGTTCEAEEPTIELWHDTTGDGVVDTNITDAGSPDLATHIVCGTTSSFSQFAVGAPPPEHPRVRRGPPETRPGGPARGTWPSPGTTRP